jgi:hypothetical protein
MTDAVVAMRWKREKFELVVNETLFYSDDVEGTKKDRVALPGLLRMRSHPFKSLILLC